MQPALSAYQRELHYNIHGPDEPLPTNLSARLRSATVDPLSKEVFSPLPSLPNTLLEKQQSLTELRIKMQTESSTVSTHLPSPPSSISPVHSHHHSVGQFKRKNFSASVIRKRSSELLLNSDPDSVMTRYFPPLESLTDPLDIVDRLKREPELGFIYLTPVEERQSVKYNPYKLR